ncbi:xanthine dehydrogenase YagR molybdenum-binding subunit [Nocardiopsis mwathae]|uniref:Xanthine dehydrogenase YagR molybdenum-binding subunit n=1 Tax=Nocardiopsis mwathae TaxID=1472723 RepID=A0A7X0D775_9ACTN|nr:xanthine dehydrogenase family protein molybdopterin-binding subunit [Nocardiopsis mwathae]MBB6172759.1 xanthine dehydrogenase YagR molybdenum-binding subunit [Nocardiopsis mwathae]
MSTPTKAEIGRPLDRIDGRSKVTGSARYSAEVTPQGTAHAIIIGSEIPAGSVTAVDDADALAAEGVLAVLSHVNMPRIATEPHLIPSLAGTTAHGQSFFPMQDAKVHYAGQPVAVVVADTLERAQFAARLLRISYEREPATTTVAEGRDHAYEAERIFGGMIPGRAERGDITAGLADAEVRVDRTYHLAANHHNPIEMSATTAVWEDSRLTLYDATQGPTATRLTVAELLGIPPSNVRVISDYVGGSFGSKAMIWHHPALAAFAAQHVRAPVKLVLIREQMFDGCGHREEQEQRVVLGARRDGTLTGMLHHKLSPTSHFDDWAEPSLNVASQMYACPNYEGVYRLFKANTMTPTFMRGPGEASGVFAVETAMDELAYELGMDPMQLRLHNHADVDPESGRPWSSKGLKECYARGAELFGWSDRDPRPGVRREGNWLIGTGMATAIYPVYLPMNPQRARARIYADGHAVIESGAADFGTGVGTVMAQVAADGLGVSTDLVAVHYGDTELPNTVAAVGSAGAGAVSAAVHTAATALRDQLIAQAVADARSPLHGADPAGVEVRDGRMMLRDRPDTGETYAELLQRNMMFDAETLGSWNPPGPDTGHGMATFGAQFAEVAVDPELGVVRTRRMVGVFAPGRVLNLKTAHSQLMGGMLWGLSQALLEATHMEPQLGRWANPSLGEYLLPVHADIPDVRVETIEVEDRVVNPLGVKGVGEIGMVGVSAAIANAVFHATGKRFHELPITIERVM